METVNSVMFYAVQYWLITIAISLIILSYCQLTMPKELSEVFWSRFSELESASFILIVLYELHILMTPWYNVKCYYALYRNVRFKKMITTRIKDVIKAATENIFKIKD